MRVISLPIMGIIAAVFLGIIFIETVFSWTTEDHRGVVWSGTEYEVVSITKTTLVITTPELLYGKGVSSRLVYDYLRASQRGDTLSLDIRKNGLVTATPL